MSNEEMTKIFSIMLLAWPNAATFKGGIKSLMPTIKLWTLCLADIDFLTAQASVIRLCQTCKFPPTIADMRETAENILLEMQNEIEEEYLHVRNEINWGESDLRKVCERMSPKTRLAIDLMGGIDKILAPVRTISGEYSGQIFDMEGFENAYRQVLLRGMKETVRLLSDGKNPA